MSFNQPPGFPPPPPTSPGYYAVPVLAPRGFSTASMVLGLISIVFGFTFVLPIIGFILGVVGLRREPAGRGMAIAGIVLNGVFVVGWALLVAAILGLFAVAAGTSVHSGMGVPAG